MEFKGNRACPNKGESNKCIGYLGEGPCRFCPGCRDFETCFVGDPCRRCLKWINKAQADLKVNLDSYCSNSDKQMAGGQSVIFL